jgi:putative heme-binding domain-containing protein
MRRLTATVAIAIVFAGTGRTLIGQHESAGAIEEGGKVYRDFCGNCHGPDGNQIAGIDLGRGQFRRALSDAELNAIIRNGIAGTAMPASSFSEEQAARIVAYVRSLAASRTSTASDGDTARGQALFERSACATCHEVNGRGSRVGPDLSAIGSLRRAVEIERSILDPRAEVLPANRLYRVVTADGETVTGRLLNVDTFTVQMLDSGERLRSFAKSALREHAFAETTMPSYRDKLSPQQVADLVRYLVSLRQ